MTRLLLDEMLAPQIAEQLRRDGLDVIAVAETADLRGAPDERVLERAASDGRVLVTANIKDFEPLARTWAERGQTHAGLLFVSAKSFPPGRHRVAGIARALTERKKAQRWPAPGVYEFL